jgi:2-haloacid dehalogenase
MYDCKTLKFGLCRSKKGEILFVSPNSFDVTGAKNFGFKVCWISRTGIPLDPLEPSPTW